jgi:hypothetical protein
VRGVFGLFTRENFVSVFYVSIMLGLNLIISSLLVDEIFSKFIRNVASCFEPIITVSIYHLFAIEVIAPGTTCLGLAFIVPGMMLIVGGQNYLAHEEIKINFSLYKQQEIQKSFLARMRAIRDRQEEAGEVGAEEGREEGLSSQDGGSR